MSDETGKEENPNPHLQDDSTGTQHGVPHGVTQEESKGLPDSGRHQSESAPLQQGSK
jgi:hypothetical protein